MGGVNTVNKGLCQVTGFLLSRMITGVALSRLASIMCYFVFLTFYTFCLTSA